MATIKKLTKEQAGYVSREHGPFMCGNCVHFGPRECDIVESFAEDGKHIKDEDCCNLYTAVDLPLRKRLQAAFNMLFPHHKLMRRP